MNEKKIVLSGIQPTGILTLGNYVGAIKLFLELQKKYKCIFFIANMHSITAKKNNINLKNLTLNLIALLMACGIDCKKNIIFVQSDVSHHAELSWVLQCHTQFAQLKRMTQFKDKSSKNTNNISSGLFCYPVLMAADILLYNPDIVPIGKDQIQHLELTRKIAVKFNKLYGEVFKIPKTYISNIGSNIKNLSNPTKKMSKSDENENAYISILDPAETIINKFKKAVTDSDSKIYYSKEKPGISNLINIYSAFSNETVENIEQKFKTKSYKDFKLALGNIVAQTFEPIQKKFHMILKEKREIEKIAEHGAKSATEIAKKTLDLVYKSIGFK